METNSNSKWMLNLRGVLLLGSAIPLLILNEHGSKNLLLMFSFLTLLAGLLGGWFTYKNRLVESSKGWLRVESLLDITFNTIFVVLFITSNDLLRDFVMLFAFFALLLFFQKISNIFRLLQNGIVLKSIPFLSRLAIAISFGISGFMAISMWNKNAYDLIHFIAIGPIIGGSMLILLSDQLYKTIIPEKIL